ncbi:MULTISPECIES: DUF1080 domain-containing protein [unclassified Novosphingobium]|uniref:3-keto-disaccharide hydrolase n=1 Tax=unclassified Novosphingobium TaxID=2644732 RepID=UPI0009E8A8DE|nr:MULTISPECIES: DUF1080 domain-containing protein [unclassified Novosphingobium]MPS69317.1 DUF1080 domain-containing protein [Novosphingobium sp.]TCM42460.1 uncharacterized protein DUF1080 [Novosphingobium sp. ST904]
MSTRLAVAMAGLSVAAAGVTQTILAAPPPAADLPPIQIIPGTPPFKIQKLALAEVPRPSGKAESLFNGRDLSAFTPWLGKPGGGMIFPGAPEQPLGRTGIGDIFRVVRVDGAPAIYVSGRTWGALNTRRAYSKYHLSLSYKFGRQWSPETPPNSGVLYHSFGKEGAILGAWASSVEFEISPPRTGMVMPVGLGVRMDVTIGEGSEKGSMGGPDYRFLAGGRLATIRMPTQVRQATDAEHPLGQWNRLDLYVAGENSVHVINGEPVMALSNLKAIGDDGKARPLTSGMIQLQSEGTEIYFRDIRIEPITTVPQIVVRN